MKKILKKIIGIKNIVAIKSLFRSEQEKAIIQKRRKFYTQFLTNQGDIYFDVGANYGNRIEPIINNGLKIIAVEPQVKCIEYLTQVYKNKITVIPKGLGEKEETKTLFIANASPISSFSKDWIDATQESGRFSQYNWNQEQKVEMTTLDNLISEHGKPRFIKIDVEGFEYQVLKGLSHPIEHISFEYTIPERKDDILQCIDQIVKIAGNNQVQFNYSIGESMDWALNEWLSPQKMKQELDTDRFMTSNFGDVYAKTKLRNKD